ncbi:MAG: hypothetical protein IME92_01855 [Proteobacteria bacterium]|nr:hypothetical protein [Pseudomonadota bacterium]
MSPYKLEAKHLVPIKDDAFPSCIQTQRFQDMIKKTDCVVIALQNTSLRFSLMQQNRRAVRLGKQPVRISA